MKTKKYYMILAMAVAITGFSCQKMGEGEQHFEDTFTFRDIDPIQVDCADTTVLSGTISSAMTLNTGEVYLLRGNVVVSNTTLTIQPGTLILGEKATNGALIIQSNATINAAGTATDPIVFTSDQSAGNRAPGDYVGLVINGAAPNNQGSSLGILINGTTYTAGGTTPAGNSGILENVQIHFAGAGGGMGSDERSEAGLILNSVGSATTIENVQVSNSGLDGLSIWGGEPKLSNIFIQDVQRHDVQLSYGYIGDMQFVAGLKREYVSALSPSHGMVISNVLPGENENAARQTYPTVSNATFLGGDYCGTGSANIENGIHFTRNGNARIFNSVVSAFRNTGLYLDGDLVIANTAGANELQFSYNSFHNSGSFVYFDNPTPSADWLSANGCSETMEDWIEGLASEDCEETGNQFSVATLGYNASICGEYCGGFTPNFTLGTTTLAAPNYSWDTGSWFSHVNYRGAFGTSVSWIDHDRFDLCPQESDYCL